MALIRGRASFFFYRRVWKSRRFSWNDCLKLNLGNLVVLCEGPQGCTLQISPCGAEQATLETEQAGERGETKGLRSSESQSPV